MSGRIRLGLIGCGFFAQNHLHAWQDLKSEGVDIVAVCDTDAERAKAAAETFGVPHWYTDAREMFEKEQLGLVDIATTMASHLPLVTLALSHRVPTIVQKPFGQTIAEVRQMVEASEQAGVFLAGEPLQSSERAVRISSEGGKRKLLDGPFSESKEIIGGYFLLEVKSRDEAMEWAARCPAAQLGGWSYAELREIQEIPR